MRGHFFKQYFAAILRSTRSLNFMSSRGFSTRNSSARVTRSLFRVGVFCLGICALPVVLGACADAGDPFDPEAHYEAAQNTEVVERIGFSDSNYGDRGDDSVEFQGQTSIADTLELINPEDSGSFVWYGFSPMDPFPLGDARTFGDTCDPFENPNFPQPINKIDELPTFIEGVVTLHPRFFQKISICGQDQRYYGAYFLQDETGGIMVLKDSRVAEFTFGERVRLRVRGVIKSFDTKAVVTFDSEESVEPGVKHDIYYEKSDGELGFDDIGQVRRVRGTIVSEPTGNNFNEMHIQDENGVDYAASVDRELAQRGIGLKNGTRIQLTGPVINSYGNFVVLVASLGQIERLDE